MANEFAFKDPIEGEDDSFESLGAVALNNPLETAKETVDPPRFESWEEPSVDQEEFEVLGEVSLQNTYAEERNKSFSLPSTSDGIESEYLIKVKNDLAPKRNFFGMIAYAPVEIAKGLTHSLLSLPGIGGTLIKAKFEVLKETPDVKGIKTILLPNLIKKGRSAFGKTKLNQKIIEGGDELQKRNEKFVEKLGLLPNAKNKVEKFLFDVGAVGGSIFTSIGVTVMTKNPSISATVFGLMQKASVYKEAREKGVSALDANKLGNLSLLSETAIELIGGHVTLEVLKGSKKISKIINIGINEFFQESGQQLGEELITNLGGIRNDDLVTVGKRIFYSGALGIVGGVSSGAVFTQIQEMGVKKDLKKLGLNDKQAQAFINSTLNNSVKNADFVAEIMDKELNPLTFDEKDQKEFIDNFKIMINESPEVEQADVDINAVLKESVRRRELILKEESLQGQLSEQELEEKAKVIAGDEVIISENAAPSIIEEDIVKGRIKKLDTDTKALEKEVIKEEKKFFKAKEQELPTKAILNKIESINKKIDALDQERGDLLTESKAAIVSSREDVVIKAKKIRSLESQIRKDEAAKITKSIKESFKQETVNVKSIKNRIISFAKKNLNLNDRSKFLVAVRDAKDINDFTKAAERMETLAVKEEARQIKTKIKKVIKATKPKNQSGKSAGNFTPAVQKVLDKAREISKLSKKDAEAKINEIQQSLDLNNPPSQEEILDNRVTSMMAGLHNDNPIELADTLFQLESLITSGKALSELKRLANFERNEEMRRVAKKTIIGDKPPDSRRVKTFTKKIKDLFSTPVSFFRSMTGWDNLMDLLSSDDKTSTEGQSDLNKIADVFNQEIGEKKSTKLATDKIILDGLKAFGFRSEKELFKRFQEDEKIIDLGEFKNNRGENVQLEISIAEARKLWMELKDPSLKATLLSKTNEDGFNNGNAYSEAMTSAIMDLLSSQDIQFAQAQLDFYKKFYVRANNAYKNFYGISLPFNEFYSPVSREFKRESSVTDAFLKEIEFRGSTSTGSLKLRTENTQPIKLQSDVKVIQKHILEMEHFINWTQKIKDLNNIFQDSETRELVKNKFGADTLQIIDKFIIDFTRGGIEKSEIHEKFFDNVRKNFTLSVLSVKPTIFLKQLTSFVAYWDFVSTKDFVSGVADFMKNPVANAKFLNENSQLLIDRGQNVTKDIQDLMKSKEFSAFKKSDDLKNTLLVLNRIGDRGAILLGGWAVYSTAKKNGKSDKQAIEEFERATQKTQQSADLSQLSGFQRGGSFAKLFTIFTSSQNQYFRQEWSAIRNFSKGRMSKGDFAKRIFIFHVLLPQFFQLVSNFGKWDEKEQLRALVMGSANGIFFLKDVLDSVVRSFIGLRQFENVAPTLEFFQELPQEIAKIDFDDIDLEEFFDAVQGISSDFLGPLLGVPVKQVYNTYEGVKDVVEGELVKGSLKLAGYSPYIVEKLLDK